MAHGFLKSFDKRLDVFSAGTAPAAQVNSNAVRVMGELGIDISAHTPTHVDEYTGMEWDYVITVCGGAREVCPAFTGIVKKRMHIGFDDPSDATGTPDYIRSEYLRVRDEIKNSFSRLYEEQLKPSL